MNVVDMQSNQLCVSVDWLAFTSKDFHSPESLLKHLGLDFSQFSKMSKGADGYKSMLRHASESITVLYDGNEDMGIHVRITSKSISYALECFKISLRYSTPFGDGYEIPLEYTDRFMIYYLKRLREISDITRIDVAIDDIGSRFFSVSDVQDLIVSGCLVSPWKKTQAVIERDINSGIITGNTCYIGSRKSDIMLRVYDKRLEQNYDIPWVRWELEIKHDRGNSFVDALTDLDSFGSASIGLLSRYVRFINLDDSNRSRCTMNDTWSLFLAGVSPLRLSILKKEPSLERIENWIKKSTAPSIAGLCVAHGGDFSWLTDNLDEHFCRLSKDKQDMFLQEGIKNVELE